jgi:hypothetical protein
MGLTKPRQVMMQQAVAFAGLVALGVLSAASYALAVPIATWLGMEPLAWHPAMVAGVFAFYLVALWLVRSRLPSTPRVMAAILGFAFLFRSLMLTTPVYLSSDLYRYLWDGRVQWAGHNPYRYPPDAVELKALRDPAFHPQINRPASVTAYPPGAQWLFALAARVAPGSIPGVLGPFSMHPWYVLWMIPFLCVLPSPAWLYFSGAVVLYYTEYLNPSGTLPWWAWLGEYGPLYVLLVAGAWRRAMRPAATSLAVRPT